MDNLLNKVALSVQSINLLREVVRVQAALNLQDELDKQSVALYGSKH